MVEDTVEWHTLVPNEEQLAIALAQLEKTEA